MSRLARVIQGKTVKAWAAELGYTVSGLDRRLRDLPVDKALTPKRKKVAKPPPVPQRREPKKQSLRFVTNPRNVEVYRQRQQGATFAALARAYGHTKQWAKQVCDKMARVLATVGTDPAR
jgi:hypothetical protein